MINRYNILLIALTCTLFSSCGLYKQYEREDMHSLQKNVCPS